MILLGYEPFHKRFIAISELFVDPGIESRDT